MTLVKQSECAGAIFDVDGTILDSMLIWDTAGERYLNKMNITAERDLGKILFALTMSEGAEYIQKTYNLEQSIDMIITGINQIVNEFYLYEVQAKLGVIDYISDLKIREIPITIATSTDRPLIEGAFKRLGILPYIDAIFTCSEVGVGKDKPDIYLQACNYMHTKPEDTYVFEDAIHAIKTANKAGFITVGVYDPVSKDKQEQIKLECDHYIIGFDQINGRIL